MRTPRVKGEKRCLTTRRALVACPTGMLCRSDTGNAKDLRWLQELLAHRGWLVETYGFDPATQQLTQEPSWPFDIAIVYYTTYPTLVAHLKAQVRRVYVRAANVEHWQAKERLQDVSQAERRQRTTLDTADGILAISEWEINKYWKLHHRNVMHLPYCTPGYSVLDNNMIEWNRRKRIVVVLPGRIDEPIGQSQIESALRIEDKRSTCSKCRDSYSLTVSAGETETAVPNGYRKSIDQAHFENPFLALKSVSGYLNPGNKGFGLKTTLVDAVVADTHPLCSATLYSRLPKYLRHWVTALRTPNECCDIRQAIDVPAPTGLPLGRYLRKIANLAVAHIEDELIARNDHL